jgi:H+-transporting ATPase
MFRILSRIEDADMYDIAKSSIEDSLQELKASDAGLSRADALSRLGSFGHNAIAEKKRKPLEEFFKRYWGLKPWLLDAAIFFALLSPGFKD